MLNMRGVLTLAELEACACLWTSWLLALHFSGIASEETLCTECLLVLFVYLHKCTCDGETESLALSGEAATVEVHLYVILVSHVEQV